MSSRINTILLIGATSGIGEALARRFHGMGKQVIATGRNKNKLDALAAELEGLRTQQFDISDLTLLPSIVAQILHGHPELDTIFINGGIQKSYNLFEPLTPTRAEQITQEIITNLTAPNILAQLFAPHLLSLAQSGKKSTIFITSSSLAYVPLSFYPTYCATKAGVHAFTKAFRQQLIFSGEASKNMNIVEVVPPYVDTGLDQEHREYTVAMQGGKDKAFPPMALDEYVDKFFESLDQLTPDGSIKKEIGIGFGQMGSDLWRSTYDSVYQQLGLSV
ncbi:NAD(P)-binding protein [Xylaria venustula]|nr:NAD(P)-binding protein [Xylaria venustula]